MELSRALAICVIAASMGLGVSVKAQSRKDVDMPNEFPSASFKGKQYVDSKGCVYIRAGVDGNVTWVPRMTRDRKVVCGYKPTNPAGGTTSTTAARVLDKNVVVIQPAAAPTGGAPVVAPAAKARPVAKVRKPAAPKPKKRVVKAPVKQAKRPAKVAPVVIAPASVYAPKPVRKPTSVTVTRPKTKAVRRRSLDQVPRQKGFEAPCRNGVVSRYKVRCGPQAELPYTPGTGHPTAPAPTIRIYRDGALRGGVGRVVREGDVGPTVRVVPRHIYEARKFAMVESTVPEGYRRVEFSDGRLNQHRAEQTFAGKARMDRLWENGVPRRLRHGSAGAVVVSSKSAPVVSSKSVPKQKVLRISGQRYVQVATYDDRATAQSVARQVRGLGVSVRIGKYTRDGGVRRIVLAGPFASATAAESAATKARRAGYSGAFVRD